MAIESGFEEIEEIFHRAVRLRGAHRERYLDEACGGKAELRREVESLLKADAQQEARLDRPLVDSLDSEEMVTLLRQDDHRATHWDLRRMREEARSNGNEVPAYRRQDEMAQVQCNRGHFYDSAEHVSCPHCGVVGLSTDMDRTRPVDPRPAGQSYGGPTKPAVPEGATMRKVNADDAPTQKYVPGGAVAAEKQIDPVVGWLVCTEGPDRGRDYRIRAQRNFIGRDVGMDICIASDPNVSRVNHATLIFDPRSNSFRIAPGDAHGMTYLNNESVDIPMTLKPYDAIELGPAGSTKLVFIPFCGEAFQWH